MDVLIGGQFTTYGTELWALSSQPIENRVDPMSKIFPRVTNHFVGDEVMTFMGHRPLSLKVTYIEFNFDVKFSTLMYP